MFASYYKKHYGFSKIIFHYEFTSYILNFDLVARTKMLGEVYVLLAF